MKPIFHVYRYLTAHKPYDSSKVYGLIPHCRWKSGQRGLHHRRQRRGCALLLQCSLGDMAATLCSCTLAYACGMQPTCRCSLVGGQHMERPPSLR